MQWNHLHVYLTETKKQNYILKKSVSGLKAATHGGQKLFKKWKMYTELISYFLAVSHSEVGFMYAGGAGSQNIWPQKVSIEDQSGFKIIYKRK